jgi:PhoD-like phosphatase
LGDAGRTSRRTFLRRVTWLAAAGASARWLDRSSEDAIAGSGARGWGASALYDFTTAADATSWGPGWLPLHYLQHTDIQAGRARFLVPKGLKTAGSAQPMPVFLLDHDCAGARQRLTFSVSDATLRPGVLFQGIAPYRYLGVTVEGRQLVLARYGRTRRRVLQTLPVSRLRPDAVYTLEVVHRADRLRAVLRAAESPSPLAELHVPLKNGGPGSLGILVVHPQSFAESVLSVLRYRADADKSFKPTSPRRTYALSGVPSLTPGGENHVRIRGGSSLPADIAFEWSEAPEGAPVLTGGFQPATDPPYIAETFVDFPAAATLYWRARLRSASSGDERVSPWLSVRPATPTGAVRLVAASCGHLWEKPAYLGFRNVAEAAGKHLHALVYQGDLGYANNRTLSCYAAAEDFFAERFTRFLADPHFGKLRGSTSTVFTQDDHDYGPQNNTWGNKVEPWAIDLGSRMVQESETGYCDFRVGDVHCLTLDVRRYADRPQPDPTATISRLGSDQYAWLESTLTSSDAELFVLFSAGIFASRRHTLDCFLQGWTREYKRALRLFHDVQLSGKRVVIASGDAHGLRVHYHPDPARRPEAHRVPVVEFICSGLEAQTWSGATADDPTLDKARNVLGTSGLGLIEIGAPASAHRKIKLRAITARRVVANRYDLFPPLVLPFRPGVVRAAPTGRLEPRHPARIRPQE